MEVKRGVKLLEQREGEGIPAKRGDKVVYNLKLFCNKGDEILLNERQAEHLPAEMISTSDGHPFIDHRITLGNRDAIAGIEYSLLGMKKGGYRKVRVSPQLAYRDKGLPDLIPPNSVLIIELWLREILAC